MNRSTRLGWVLSACLLGSAVPSGACGPYDYIVELSDPHWPGDLSVYGAGDLGVLGEDYHHRLLWVAYRHLNDRPVPNHPDLLRSFRHRAPTESENPVTAWIQERNRVPGVEREERSWIESERRVREVSGEFEYYTYMANCLDDAFRNATRTLQDLIETHGLDSKAVAEWVKGQDAVFSNCSEGRLLPVELDAQWPQWLRWDREYQLAAAYFYSEGFAEAERRFREIAGDTRSPWSTISHYLVARALARQGRLAEAIGHLDGLLADPSLSEWHPSARKLRDHYLHRHDPQAIGVTLAERLGSEAALESWDQDLEDLDRILHLESYPEDDLTLWIRLLHQVGHGWGPFEEEWALAVARWQSTGQAHWWLAAAMIQDADHRGDPNRPNTSNGPWIERLLDDLPTPEGPGRLSMLYHRLRLQHLAGRLDTPENEALLGSLLDERLSISDRNRFSFLYRHLADDLDTWLRRSFGRPARAHYDEGAGVGPEEEGDTELPVEQVFDAEATELLNRLPPSRLLELAERAWLPELHRQRLAKVAWIRAVLMEDWVWVAERSAHVARICPDLGAELSAVASADESTRSFEAALRILRDRRWDPVVHPANSWIDYQDQTFVTGRSWWCEQDLPLDDSPAVGRMIRPESAAAPKAWSVVEAPLHFAPTVFAFADAHPDDPRVPEALHRLVHATRYSCGQGIGKFAGVSKRAFQRLHRRFPTNPWTKKTPYWFE